MPRWKENSSLCQPCQRLLGGLSDPFVPGSGYGSQEYLRENYRLHHPDHLSFRQSVDSRCHLCYLISVEADRAGIDSESLVDVIFLCAALEGRDDGRRVLEFQVHRSGILRGRVNRRIFSLYMDLFPTPLSSALKADVGEEGQYDAPYSESDKVLCFSNLTIDLVSTTRSHKAMELMRQWLADCLGNHPECRNTELPETYRPTRLIHVGKEDDKRVHLEVSESPDGFEERYATLSHRWGEREHPKLTLIKLTTENESRLRTGIGLEELPNTFRDAVEVTRSLGLEYLWIDSMCIFQDSDAKDPNSDWRKESVKMGGIYDNCVLNLAATVSEDSDGGLFRDRDILMTKELKMMIHWPPYPVHNRPIDSVLHPELFICIKSSLWRDNVDNTPLNTRAWVIQERTLAPRLVQFGQDQLYWECKRKQACESAPLGLRISRHKFIKTRILAALDDITEISGPIGPPHTTSSEQAKAVQLSWIQCVTNYSLCQITREKDLLIAMSGIAKAFEGRLNDKYLAGILRSQFHVDLLWHTTSKKHIFSNQLESNLASPYSPKSRQSEILGRDLASSYRPRRLTSDRCSWRAPSWSWASIKGAVTWEETFRLNHQHLYMMELLDYYIEPIGTDSTGELLDAWMKVNATFLPIEWPLTSSSEYDYEGQPYITLVDTLDYNLDIAWDEYEPPTHILRSSVKAMPVLAMSSFEEGGNRSTVWYGLILDSSSTNHRAVAGHSRIGYFTMTLGYQNQRAMLMQLKATNLLPEEVLLI